MGLGKLDGFLAVDGLCDVLAEMPEDLGRNHPAGIVILHEEDAVLRQTR